MAVRNLQSSFLKQNLKDAITVAEHIRKAVMNKELIKKSSGQKLGRVTMSFGIAQFKPDDTVESLIARSDKLLYAAKHAGRNNVQTELNQQAGQEEMAKKRHRRLNHSAFKDATNSSAISWLTGVMATDSPHPQALV